MIAFDTSSRRVSVEPLEVRVTPPWWPPERLGASPPATESVVGLVDWCGFPQYDPENLLKSAVMALQCLTPESVSARVRNPWSDCDLVPPPAAQLRQR